MEHGGGGATERRVATAALPAVFGVDFNEVYEPREDSWLFCDALLREMPSLLRLRPALVAEIGPGSGVVSTYLMQQFEGACAAAAVPFIVVVDINPAACAASCRTAAANCRSAQAGGAVAASSAPAVGTATVEGASGPARAPLYDAVIGDLLAPLLPRLRGQVDVLLFNPPYVPTDPEEVPSAAAAARLAAGGAAPAKGALLPAAWAGGDRGRQVTDRLLPQLPLLLTPVRGVAYLVLVEENEPAEVAAILAALGMRTAIVASRRATNELLHVMRVWFDRKK